MKFNISKNQFLIIAIFLIFMFLRVFTDSPYFFIQGGDAGRYLTLANNFPYHTFSNNQFYIMHQPLYPYTIYFLSFLFEDYLAGIAVSLISSAITFFIIYKLTMLLSNSRNVVLGTLILFSVSQIYIHRAGSIIKEPFAVMIILAAIYYYLKFLKEGNNKYWVYSAIFGFITGLTTDHALLLILSLITVYFIFRNKLILKNKTKIWYAAIPLIVVIISYSSWIFTRAYVYITNDFYPASFDGTIVNTSVWGLRQLLSSQYFNEISVYIPFGWSFNPLHYIYTVLFMFNLILIPWPSGLTFSNIANLLSPNQFIVLVVYGILVLSAIYGFYRIIKSAWVKKSYKENGMLLCVVLFLIFLSPLAQKFTSTRWTITAIIFLYILTSFGLIEIAKKLKILKVYKWFLTAVVLALLIYLPFYYASNPYFILNKEKLVEVPKTAGLINLLPEDGVMAQVGYTQELNYLTNKRVMALPINPDYMFLIDRYNISYLIYGEFYMMPLEEGDKDIVFNYETIKYIRNHPEKFRLLKVIEESYPTLEKKDHIYIYEVIPN